MGVAGRVAFVTGAGSGIGRSIAQTLGAMGARVVVADIDETNGKAVAAGIDGSVFVGLDVTTPRRGRRGGDAGTPRGRRGRHRRELRGNRRGEAVPRHRRGAVGLPRAAQPVRRLPGHQGPPARHGRARATARIVNIASDAGRVGSAGEAVYSGCKGGVIAFTKTIAREVARHGITANSVCPGPTETPPLQRMVAEGGDKYIACDGAEHPARPLGPTVRRCGRRGVLRVRGGGLRHRSDAVRQRRDVDGVTTRRGLRLERRAGGEGLQRCLARAPSPQIQREVVERNLQPGDVLGSEAVMLARFGVGRASLREALRILENHGVIRIKPGPGGGPVVNEVTSDDWGRAMTIHLHSAQATFRDLLEARVIMEPVVARLAASRLTPEGRAAILAAAAAGRADAPMSDPPDEHGRPPPRTSMPRSPGPAASRVVDLFSSSLISIHRARVGSSFPNNEREATCLDARPHRGGDRCRRRASCRAADAPPPHRAGRRHRRRGCRIRWTS